MSPFKDFNEAIKWLQDNATGPVSVLLINETEILSGSFTLRSKKYKENLKKALVEKGKEDANKDQLQ
jgi:hypothetical protein